MSIKPAYYNEIDEYAAQWLRNLIAAGHIAPGDVDTRSIEDVKPDDLRPYTQCHFFAGIGVWSLALRRAGWADDRHIWTASCPCQPFSAAGQGAGFADERHLWPHLYHLIDQRRPAIVVGEQVASKDADPWLDLVQTDMEAVDYAFGAVAFPSAGVGAPHIRDRTYWVAHANGSVSGEGRTDFRGRFDRSDAQPRAGSGGCSVLDGLAYAAGSGPQGREPARQRADAQRAAVERSGAAGGVEYADGGHTGAEREQRRRQQRQQPEDGGTGHGSTGPSAVNGLWRDADWLFCRDGKWRPVEPGTFPLAHGAAARVGRLRAYGNAVNAEAARVWIETVMDCTPA